MATYKRVAGDYTIQTLGANTITLAGNVANAVTVVIDGNLSVSGNATLSGNISGDRLFNGTTSIEIQTASGNANVSVGGVSNVAVFTPTGLVVTGLSIPGGDFSAANISATGYMSAVGNIISSASINANGNIFITRDASVGQPTVRFADIDTTASANTVVGAIEWYTSDATAPGARVTTAVRSTYTDTTGNAKLEILTGTTATPAVVVTVLPTGNVGVANANPNTTFGVTGTGYFTSNLQSAGNLTGGNLITAGLVTATGNVQGGNLVTTGLVTVTGNITGGNLSVSGGISAGAAGITATGNIRGGNLVSDAQITATGNVTGDNFITQGIVTAQGNVIANNVSVGNIVSTVVVNATGNISATGNVTGANLVTTGLVTATGNVNAGAFFSAGQLVTVGNITTTSGFFVGDGGFLSNITAISNTAATQLSNGTTVLAVASSNGNIVATVNSIGNIMVLWSGGANFTGGVSVTGNISAANVNSLGNVSVTGNVNTANILVTGTANIGTLLTNNINANALTSGTVDSGRLSGSYVIDIQGNASGTSSTVINGAQPNITSVGNLTSVVVVGNATVGNLNTAGVVSATGNITGGNVNTGGVVSAVGNLIGGNLQAAGLSLSGNVVSAINTTANITTTANISGGNVLGTHVGSVAFGAGSVSGTGNITGGNIIGTIVAGAITGTSISVSGNVTGGNINTAGLVSATGNIIGGNLQATGLSLSGNVVSAINTTSNIATTANISGGNLIGTIATASQTNITSVGTLGSLTVTANVTAGNFETSGTTGILSVNSITHLGTNAVGNIGSASSYFNQVFATATTALYADLAEKYSADADYSAGTVVSFGGSAEVTQSEVNNDRKVAGVVSAKPSYLMNAGLESTYTAAVALQGRVPCYVIGSVRKGDMMVSAGGGRARAEENPILGTVIGKALEDFDGDFGTIEVVVGRI